MNSKKIALTLMSLGLLCLVILGSGCPGPEPKDGKRAQLDGYKLFYRDTGATKVWENGKPTPTVVMISGLNDNLSVWTKVQDAIALNTRVISYDRGGVGWSDLGPNPRTGGQLALELHFLLEAIGVEGPYILVGHSFGGLYARLFANAYPTDVYGIVLIDTVHEDRENRQALILDPSSIKTLQTGERLLTEVIGPPGSLGEFQNRVNTFQEIRAKRRLQNIPLVFLSRDKDEFSSLQRGSTEAYQLEFELDEAQASLVPNGELRIVTGASHVVQKDNPQAVIDAINDVMTKSMSMEAPTP
jgi:pimeloyl-ACP methyl ester carboxylesterase